jgi:D-3-phosphoglycerate dehydrogenase
MADFKVALVAFDGQPVPDWATRRLADNGIDLVARECRTTAEVIELGVDADVLWVFGGSPVITADCLPELPRCLAILRTGTGTDNVPLAAASAAGIVVAITPDAGSDTVAEHAVALMLALLRQVASQDRLVRAGVWDRDRAWPHWSLRGQALGLIGFGAIARALVRRLSGFELSIVAYDPFVGDETFERYGVARSDLREVLRTCRVVSLHCPLNEDTYHLIGEPELRSMRGDAILVNTARGRLIDETALYRAVAEGWISGAALDVLESEPPDPGSPLLRLNDVIVTPHIAAYSDTFFADSWRLSVETIVDLADGRWPRASANPGVNPRRRLSRTVGSASDDHAPDDHAPDDHAADGHAADGTDNHRRMAPGGVPSPNKGQADDRTVGSPQETVG